MKRTALVASMLIGLACSPASHAWKPSGTVKIVAAQAQGSSNDLTARSLGEYMTEHFKETFIIENKAGGGGMIAADAVAKSAPDGKTLLITLHSNLAQAPAMLKKPPIDPDKDLIPICAYSTGFGLVVANAESGINSFEDLLARAKKEPVPTGNYAIGSGWQIMLAQLAEDTGGQFNVVNYRGTGQMVQDLAGGTVVLGAGSLAGLKPFLDSGKVKPIVSLNPFNFPSDDYPDLRTFNQLGFNHPVYSSLVEMNMLLAPAGTPDEAVKAYADACVAAASTPRMSAILQDQMGMPAGYQPMRGEELKALIDRTWPVYREMTRSVGIQPQ